MNNCSCNCKGKCTCKDKHPNHKEQIPNLNRAIGQLEGIKKMIEQRRYCPDIITQLKASKNAIASIESSLLSHHLNFCVRQAFDNKNEEEIEKKISEIISLFKKY